MVVHWDMQRESLADLREKLIKHRIDDPKKLKEDCIESDHSITYNDSSHINKVLRQRIRLVTHAFINANSFHKTLHVLTKFRFINKRAVCEVKVVMNGGSTTENLTTTFMDSVGLRAFERDWRTLWKPEITHLDTSNFEHEAKHVLQTITNQRKDAVKLKTGGRRSPLAEIATGFNSNTATKPAHVIMSKANTNMESKTALASSKTIRKKNEKTDTRTDGIGEDTEVLLEE